MRFAFFTGRAQTSKQLCAVLKGRVRHARVRCVVSLVGRPRSQTDPPAQLMFSSRARESRQALSPWLCANCRLDPHLPRFCNGCRLCDSRPFHNNIQFFILELLLYLGKLGAVFGVGAPSLTPSGERSAFLSRGSSGQVQLMWRVHWGMEPYIFTPLCFGHWDGTAAWVHQGCGQHGGLKPARLILPLCWPASGGWNPISVYHCVLATGTVQRLGYTRGVDSMGASSPPD